MATPELALPSRGPPGMSRPHNPFQWPFLHRQEEDMRRLLPVLIAMTWLAEGRAAAGADLVCVEPLVDKGLVRSGSPLAQRFTLVNRGREAVEITEVKPSCGCLVPRLEKRLLQA